MFIVTNNGKSVDPSLISSRFFSFSSLYYFLSREPFPDSAIRLSDYGGGDGGGDDAGVRNNHPGGGKKGRRRKGHKKKIKRIKPTAGSLASGSDPTITPPDEWKDPWRGGGGAKMTDEINSSLTSVTKLSLNESKPQTLGRKKHRQKLTSQTSSSAETTNSETSGGGDSPGKARGQKLLKKRQGGNWDRKAGRGLLVLNGDDIHDKNMQTASRTDPLAKEVHEEGVAVNLLGWNREPISQTVGQFDFQRDRQRRKLTPVEKEARKQRQKELLKLEKQRKQARRLMKGECCFFRCIFHSILDFMEARGFL